MVAGVASGIAALVRVDPTLVRIVAVLLALVTKGGAVFLYALLWVFVPEEPAPGADGPGPSYAERFVDSRSWAPRGPDVTTTPTAQTPTGGHDGPPRRPDGRPRSRSGLFFGMLLVVVGVSMLLDAFIPGVSVRSLWPLAVIAFGVYLVLRPKGS